MFENQSHVSERVSPQPLTAREQILAAARALFEGREYESVHIRELIQEASVSRATFYRIFASKEAAFREACASAPFKRGALERIREGAREAFGRKGYERVRVEDMIASAGVARSTFYRFFKDKNSAFLELDRTAFEYLRWELGVSSVDPVGRREHLEFTVESFVEWRSQVGRTSLQPGQFPTPPEQAMVAFHTLLDGVNPDAKKAVLDSRLPVTVVNALLVAVDSIAQQPYEGDRATQNAARVRDALALVRPVVEAPRRAEN